MLNNWLETECDIVQDVMNGEPLKRTAKSRTKASGKAYSQESLMTLHSMAVGEEYMNVWQ